MASLLNDTECPNLPFPEISSPKGCHVFSGVLVGRDVMMSVGFGVGFRVVGKAVGTLVGCIQCIRNVNEQMIYEKNIKTQT